MNSRLKKLLFSAMTLIALPSILSAEEVTKLAPANQVRTVWNLTLQPCNGGGGNAYTPHPKATEAIKSKRLDLPEIGYSFAIPQLPDIDKTVVKVRLGAMDRGVKDHYILISDQDLKEPVAAIVITELPNDMQSNQSAFKAVDIIEAGLAKKSSFKPVLKPVTGLYGEALELLVPNRIGTHCYPTAEYNFAQSESNLRTISISRFTVIGKNLVEFALILNVKKDVSGSEAEAYARRIMDGYWRSLEAI